MRKELIYEMWMDLHGPGDKNNRDTPIRRARERLSLNPLVEYLTGVLIPSECNELNEEGESGDSDDNPVIDDGFFLNEKNYYKA